MKVRIEYKNIGRERYCETKIYNGTKEFIVEMIFEELKHHLISKYIKFDEKDLFDLNRTDVYAGYHKVGEVYLNKQQKEILTKTNVKKLRNYLKKKK